MATLPEVTHDEIPTYSRVDVTDFDVNYLDGKLGEVVDQIKSRWGSVVESRLAAGTLTERLFKAVVVRVAAREFGNEDGFKSETEGQYSYERSALVASGYLWFSDIDERDLTGRVALKKNGRVGTSTVRRQPGWP